MCHIQGDHETPCLYVQDRCWYVDRTLAFPSSCLLCFEEDLVYHRRGIACRLAVQSSWEFIYPSRRRLFREVLSLLMASKRTWCIIACRLAVQSSWEVIYPSRRRLFREMLRLAITRVEWLASQSVSYL